MAKHEHDEQESPSEMLFALKSVVDKTVNELAQEKGRLAASREELAQSVTALRKLGAKGSKASEVLKSARELRASSANSAREAIAELEQVQQRAIKLLEGTGISIRGDTDG